MVDRIVNIFAALIGLMGLAAGAVGMIMAFRGLESGTRGQEALLQGIETLGLSLAGVCFLVVLLATLHYISTSTLQRNLASLPELTRKTNQRIRANRSIANTIHNFGHSHRYIDVLFRNYIFLKKEELHQNDIQKVCHMFDKYMLSLLSNIAETCGTITEDECAVCIKIVKDDKVKTWYRDPGSYRRRKRSDYTQSGRPFIYEKNDNFAFSVISNEKTKDTFFSCDNLREHREYFNKNPEWNKLYNATIVVPIQANLAGDKRDQSNQMQIVGFLCCDNMRGGFLHNEIKDFLSAIGDMLFNQFYLYDRFVNMAIGQGMHDEKPLLGYVDWN